MSLVQYSSCCRVFPEASGISGLLGAIGFDAVEELVAMEEDRSIAASRDLDTTLSSSCCSCILFAIVEQKILGAASGAEMADIEQMKKIVPLITCGISLAQNVCDLMFGVNVTDLDLGVQISPVTQPIQSNSVGS